MMRMVRMMRPAHHSARLSRLQSFHEYERRDVRFCAPQERPP